VLGRLRAKGEVVATSMMLQHDSNAGAALRRSPEEMRSMKSRHGDPVPGFPGANGQGKALGTDNTFGAWNGHIHSDQIIECAE